MTFRKDQVDIFSVLSGSKTGISFHWFQGSIPGPCNRGKVKVMIIYALKDVTILVVPVAGVGENPNGYSSPY